VAGFVAQLVLIFFVTSLGLGGLESTDARLRNLVQKHMVSLELSKTMQVAVRERTVSLAHIAHLSDPFEQDEELQRYWHQAELFNDARHRLLNLSLTDRERALLDDQWQLSLRAVPLQREVIDLSRAGHPREAQRILSMQTIPAQDEVMRALLQLDDEIRNGATSALEAATLAHDQAHRWIMLLSTAALLLGMLIASVVVRKIHNVNTEREHLATHDALTGLPNRTLLLDRIDQGILRAHRHKTRIGLLFIDLDGFKSVNDSLGHSVGDEVLKAIAARLKQVVRAGDIVARLGGDEFIVGLLDVSKRHHIEHVSEKLLDAIGHPMRIAGHDIQLSGSVGVCVYPDDGSDAKNLVKRADFAMYAAKKAGKNRIRHFTQDLSQAQQTGTTGQGVWHSSHQPSVPTPSPQTYH